MKWIIRIGAFSIILSISVFIIKARYFPTDKLCYWAYQNKYAKKNWDTINETVKYYAKRYGTCPNSVRIKYVDKRAIKCGKEIATGCTAIWANNLFLPQITIATKGRTQCEMIETTIHELRHACENIPDCYDDPECWAYKLNAEAPLICQQIQNAHNP